MSDYYDQDVTVRINGEAATWLRRRQIEEVRAEGKSFRQVTLRGMVQEIIEQRMEEESGTGNDREGTKGSRAD